ncbi:MAG: hypothetical protein CL943_02095 [Candidatus Diapherotrites archaeon]|uniref:Geranylgeranylglycerol-phosphate geranylgeranyltransferase n=1 Tax=Candidatus Iainarchaeum sp. TaxID=3101447 RepID=A0A2D6M0X8_9ARCH|nr:hypothetical protein [Candidatus Diapherotrites archaeon]
MSSKDYVTLLRPFNCIMAVIGVFIGYSIAFGSLVVPAQLGIAMVAAFLICGAGMVINDVFDAGVDKKLHPEKPIPSGRVSTKTALLYSNSLFILANLLALYALPLVSFAIAFVFSILFIVYAKWLPKLKYIGNWVVASGTAFTLIFGASLVGNFNVVLIFAATALLTNASREIVKDIEDMEQDKGFKVSLPMVTNVGAAKYLAFMAILLAFLLSYIPAVLFSFGGVVFVLLISIANLGFLYSVNFIINGNYTRAQRLLKASMFLALLSFLSGVVL